MKLLVLATLLTVAGLATASADSCDKDPNSYLCMIERDREAEPDQHVRAQYDDIQT